jgi:hypothetical protein
MTAPAWDELGPAEFDRRRMPKGHQVAAPDQGGLFFMAVDPAPVKVKPGRPELDGQAGLFGDPDDS